MNLKKYLINMFLGATLLVGQQSIVFAADEDHTVNFKRHEIEIPYSGGQKVYLGHEKIDDSIKHDKNKFHALQHKEDPSKIVYWDKSEPHDFNHDQFIDLDINAGYLANVADNEEPKGLPLLVETPVVKKPVVETTDAE